jgi:hypothetical protein
MDVVIRLDQCSKGSPHQGGGEDSADSEVEMHFVVEKEGWLKLADK